MWNIYWKLVCKPYFIHSLSLSIICVHINLLILTAVQRSLFFNFSSFFPVDFAWTTLVTTAKYFNSLTFLQAFCIPATPFWLQINQILQLKATASIWNLPASFQFIIVSSLTLSENMLLKQGWLFCIFAPCNVQPVSEALGWEQVFQTSPFFLFPHLKG